MTSEHHSETSANGTAPVTASTDEMKTAESTPQPVGPAKIVKRYSNRKLYDTQRSKYVTLDEIARMIKAGEEVTIIDNESKEDLTSVTLTQIIYEEEKRESRMPLGMLRNLIQTGGTSLQEFFDRSVKAPVVEGIDSAQKSVEELRQSALQIKDNAARSVNEITDAARRLFSREERKAEEFQKALKVLFDHLDERVADRITDVAAAREELAKRPAPGGDSETATATSTPTTTPTTTQTATEPGTETAETGAPRPDEPLRVAAHVELIRTRMDSLRKKVDELAEHI